MSNNYFQFKQFTVFHDKCAMKVGMDSVLLGAWTDVTHSSNILDIGTGSGLIALMLAQRCTGEIIGIDIDKNATCQAIENVNQSPWTKRIKIKNISLQEFEKEHTASFDLIVSNPPYFNQSLKTPAESRTNARHTDQLPHSYLLQACDKMLTANGKFCLILPIDEAINMTNLAPNFTLFCSRQIKIIHRPNLKPKRMLLEFKKTPVIPKIEILQIENENHLFTTEYVQLTKDFYLKM